MKKMFIGIFALSTLTAFANCDVKITGNMRTDRVQLIKSIITEKGYNVTKDATSYELYVNGFSGISQECDLTRYLGATLNDLRQQETVYHEVSMNCGLFAPKKWNKRISTVLEHLPHCNQ